MFSIWTLVAITFIYILVLFAIAIIGDRAKKLPKSVYSFALGIHCTSWAFFGTTTQAAQFGWPLIPTYLGLVLVMLFGFKFLLRVNTICKQYNVSSIAEFVSIRYDHSNLIASIVTIICMIGVIPYIALQLDAISLALNLLIVDADTWSSSISLYVTIGMAIFAIWFGARKMSLTERNSGLMLTIATQSLVKLLALLCIGLFVVYGVFDGFVDLFERSLASNETRELINKPFAYWIYISHILLGVCSMFCLPRQFHINFVENRNEDELHQARWLFPLYLLGMSIFILPIALGGMLFFSDPVLSNVQQSTDSYVLAIPIALESKSIAIVAYLGGLAASTSMVIVATLALGNMVANSLITPLLFAFNANKMKALAVKDAINEQFRLSGHAVLRIRQLTILIMLFIAYIYHVNISQQTTLVLTGTIALSLLSQTFPAIVFGIYWRNANRLGALSGVILGVIVVIVGMFYPSIVSEINSHQIAMVLFASFAVNIMSILIVSVMTKSKLSNPYASSALNLAHSSVGFNDLLRLTDKILPSETAQKFREQVLFAGMDENNIAPSSVLNRAEKLLSSHMGSASTRILLNTIINTPISNDQGLSELVEQAGRNFQFNHKVLQASITHLPLGISVVDANLKLVAWNRLYEQLFDYPKDYLEIGKPILDILQFNAQRGLLGQVNSQQEIQKRMHNMLIGKSYKTVRPQLHGKVVEIAGNPLPAGGYISCYSDITEYIHIQNELESAKIELEKRVEKRTKQLHLAKTEAEQANIGKTKFLAATSHDLMQPLNAASLFASMLQEKLQGKGEFELAENLVNSLDNAESLLNMLIDITKLENKRIKPNLQRFKLDVLLSQLVSEFTLLANQKSIELVYVPTSLWVNTDRRLLSRVIQNLLSNAVRYTEQGKILIGIRRRNTSTNSKLCELVVADTGSGIAEEDQMHIFNEFQRINPNDRHQGLGLGLTIVDKISQLLNYNLQLRSQVNKGSVFSLQLMVSKPLLTSSSPINTENKRDNIAFLTNKTVLILENDKSVLSALRTLFTSWGAQVLFATSQNTVDLILKDSLDSVDLIIADYHLDVGDTGVNVALNIQAHLKRKIKTVLSSADRSESIQALAYEHNMQYLPKPIKQAALKRLLQKLFE